MKECSDFQQQERNDRKDSNTSCQAGGAPVSNQFVGSTIDLVSPAIHRTSPIHSISMQQHKLPRSISHTSTSKYMRHVKTSIGKLFDTSSASIAEPIWERRIKQVYGMMWQLKQVYLDGLGLRLKRFAFN